jgi:S1-C subfamily serine protease
MLSESRIRIAALLIVVAVVGLAGAIARAEMDAAEEERILAKARSFEESLVRVARKIRLATVAIENWRPRKKGQEPVLAGGGSGVIISSKGFVLTNQHVVQGAVKLFVVLHDGRRVDAKVIGADERGDIALLKIPNKRIRYVNPKRVNTEKLKEGAWVLACGNPFFTGREGRPIVTLGIISGLERAIGGQFMYGNCIQHDAEINPGNSGGPLFDLNGNLLAINGRINARNGDRPSNCGVGYSIPMHQVRNFLGLMIDGARGTGHGDELLGLEVSTAKDTKGKPCGALVKKVKKASPAARARNGGIRPQDVVWQVAVRGRNHKIFSATDYVNVLSTLAAGSKVTVYVKRGKRRLLFKNILLQGPTK